LLVLALHHASFGPRVKRNAFWLAVFMLFGATAAEAQRGPAPNWAGIYLGAHGGYEWTSIQTNVPTVGLPLVTPGAPGSVFFPISSADVTLRPQNATGGILAGQNFRWGLYGLLGWEADATWGHGSASTLVGGTLVSGSVDWAASLRARFGYVSGLWLFYGTAGVGWERVNLSLQSALNGAFNGSRRYARSLISNSADASHPAQAS
jgi:hypothetical protein